MLAEREIFQDVNPAVEQSPKSQYCVFRSGRERYCLSVLEVEEVVSRFVLTRVPLAPPFLMGIFNLRGVIVPVLDIAHDEDRHSDNFPTRLVVASWKGASGHGTIRVGLAVDEMLGTFQTSEPLLVEEAPRKALPCRGLLRHEDRLVFVLDIRRLAEAFLIPAI
jgi:purine-binding chemotaxis protein CheW